MNKNIIKEHFDNVSSIKSNVSLLSLSNNEIFSNNKDNNVSELSDSNNEFDIEDIPLELIEDSNNEEENGAIEKFNIRAISIISSDKVRIVHDFVHINALIKSDINNVPLIEEAFVKVVKANLIIFSKIDLRSIYLQILLRECDCPITVFTYK
jgi:hypothetical protein